MEIIKRGFFLMTVCALAALALAFTNQTTEPLIAKQRLAEKNAALARVLSRAATFEKVDGTKTGAKTYYKGIDKEGNTVGVAFEVAPKGYAGPVIIMVGLDERKRVTGAEILETAETPGLGAKAADEAFIGQFKEKSVADLWLSAKDDKKGEIDAVTAATITSRAVTSGIRKGVEEMSNVLP